MSESLAASVTESLARRNGELTQEVDRLKAQLAEYDLENERLRARITELLTAPGEGGVMGSLNEDIYTIIAKYTKRKVVWDFDGIAGLAHQIQERVWRQLNQSMRESAQMDELLDECQLRNIELERQLAAMREKQCAGEGEATDE